MSSALLVLPLALAFAAITEASVVADASKENMRNDVEKPLQPTLQPESRKKFFMKDYGHDVVAERNGLHFKHPYPAVQDTEEYDTDFVKDQNSDNGEYQAQMTYDRIRAQMEKQYTKTEKALEKKKEAKDQLAGTVDDFKEEVVEAKEKKREEMDDLESIYEEKMRALENKKVQKEEVIESSDDTCWWPWSMWCCGWWPWSCPAEPADPMDKYRDAHREMATDVTDGTRQVEEAVRNLKKCEKEFVATRKALKKQLQVLERVNTEKVEADKKVDPARRSESEAETQVSVLKETLAEQVAEYDAAHAAYLKQKAVVDKLRPQLAEKAKAVEAMRDAEDKNGGVYQVETDHDDVARRSRSSARTTQAWLFVFVAMVAMVVN